jgi:hypothetical protein
MSIRLAKRFHRAARHYEHEGAVLRLQDVLLLHGDASTPVILLLMATFCLMPVGGIGTVLSFAMVALAWRWAQLHETTQLPDRIARVELNDRWTQRTLKSFFWLYLAAARWLKPRWVGLTHHTLRTWWALWISLMAFLIFLPIPFGNVLPGLSLMLFSLGWMFRDGLFLLLSKVVGISAVVFALFFGHVVLEIAQRALNWVQSF